MEAERPVVVIPGLGDQTFLVRATTFDWRKYGLKVYPYNAHWNNKDEDFLSKIDRLNCFLEKIYADKGPVGIVGISASASLAFNILFENPDKVVRVVTHCGRLYQGTYEKPTLQKAARGHHAFEESVIFSQDRSYRIRPIEKRKILSVRSQYDPVVPFDLATIPGAKDLILPPTFPYRFHFTSIYYGLRRFRKEIIEFIKS